MTLDQYELCPCGRGKKIKFCCSRDIIHEMDRIQRMIKGEQRLAALEKLEALLEKHPERPSLLMMKVEIELQLQEPQKALDTCNALARVDEDNPSIPATQSLLVATFGNNPGQAIGLLQRAFSLVDGTITPRMYEAVLVVAKLLERLGQPLAAKGHLQMALALTEAKDEQCGRALMQLNQNRDIPMILREPYSLYACPENVTWQIEFNSAMREVYRGRWHKGAELLSAMSIRILDEPSILFNQAIVHAWLADNEKATRALLDFARIRDVPLDERVAATAIAQYLSPEGHNVLDVVGQTHEVESVDEILAKALAHDCLSEMPADENLPSDAPRPRGVFDVLDRPTPKELDNLQLDQIPRSLGVIVLFGKETDRSARVMLTTARPHFDKLKERCAELLGISFGEPTEDEVVGRTPWLSAEVLGTNRIPEGLKREEQERLIGEIRIRGLTETWPQTPSPYLDGKTPTEAAEDPANQITLLAMLLNLELLARDGHWGVDFNQLRERLGLPLREQLSMDEVDLNRLPIHRYSQLDISSLSDEDLLTVYRRSYAVMSVHTLRPVALEVIARPGLDSQIDKVEAYDILSDVAPTSDESLEYLDKARKLATSEGESPAAWLIDEMELRLLRGEIEKFVKLLKEIQARYIKEPGIAPVLIEKLSRYGLVTPDGRIMVPAPPEESESSGEQSSGLWTPDGTDSAPTGESGESESESKLWVPGMD